MVANEEARRALNRSPYERALDSEEKAFMMDTWGGVSEGDTPLTTPRMKLSLGDLENDLLMMQVKTEDSSDQPVFDSSKDSVRQVKGGGEGRGGGRRVWRGREGRGEGCGREGRGGEGKGGRKGERGREVWRGEEGRGEGCGREGRRVRKGGKGRRREEKGREERGEREGGRVWRGGNCVNCGGKENVRRELCEVRGGWEGRELCEVRGEWEGRELCEVRGGWEGRELCEVRGGEGAV